MDTANGDLIEINVSCTSENEDVSLGCGIGYESDGCPIDLNDVDWLWAGLSDCFWELCFEFEEGIDKAKRLIATEKNLTLEEALFQVFGHFDTVFEVNGEERDLQYNFDFDAYIYDLILNCC